MRISYLSMLGTVFSVFFSGQAACLADEKSPDMDKLAAEIRAIEGTVEFDESQTTRPIVSIRISGFQATDALLERLKTLTTLKQLCVTNCSVTDAGLRQLGGLTELQYLDLWGTKITDDGLKTLSNFPKLEALGLLSCENITDAGLKHLENLKNLRELDLRSTKIGDAGLEHLAGLTKLQSLHLLYTKVTDAGLQTVQTFTELRELSLDSTNVSDAGLEYLKTLTKLRRLSLGGKISNRAVNALKKSLPNAFVTYCTENSKPDPEQDKLNAAMDAINKKINSLIQAAPEIAKCEADGKNAADQKKKALAIIDEIADSKEDIGVHDGFVVAELAFLLGANDKAIAVMEKVVRRWPKEHSPSGLNVPVDSTGTFHIGTYARYGNNPKLAAVAYMSLLDMARESPEIYEGLETACYFYLAEIESHFNRDSAKAIEWLNRIVNFQPQKITLGETNPGDRDRSWKFCQNLARHEITLLQGKQPDWRGALDDEESACVIATCLLLDNGLIYVDEQDDLLLQLAIRSNVSRLDLAAARHQLGAGMKEQAFTDDKAKPSFLKDLMESDSFFAPAGGTGLARWQMNHGKAHKAQETMRKLAIRFPTLKKEIEAIQNDMRLGSP